MADVSTPPTDAELDALGAILGQAFARPARSAERWRERVDRTELRVVRRRGDVVGGLRIMRMGQWFGGGVVPMAGIAAVGVAPEHRGTGAAAQLMRSTLDELHTDGFPISVLFPAADGPYRRFGYERAGTNVGYSVPLRAFTDVEPALDVSRLEPDDVATMKPVYDRRAATTAGNLDRHPGIWAADDDTYVYAVGRPDAPDGYIAFAQRRSGDRVRYDLRCTDIVAATPDAARTLFAFCAGHRSMAVDLRFPGAPNEPMLSVVREQDWTVTETFHWMLRVVDVRGALEARRYAPGIETEVHLDVRDDTLGWNHGRFVLEVSGGSGSVRKGGRGSLALDVRGLAALYTGYQSTGQLAIAGLTDDAEPRADALFAGPAPWMPDTF